MIKNHPEKALRKRLCVSTARRRPNLSLYTCVCKETLKSKLTWTRSHSPPHCRDGCSFPCLSLFLVYRNHFNELILSRSRVSGRRPVSRLRLQRYYKKTIQTKFFDNFFSRNFQIFSLPPEFHPLTEQKNHTQKYSLSKRHCTRQFTPKPRRQTQLLFFLNYVQRAATLFFFFFLIMYMWNFSLILPPKNDT